jgi:hypothetical protein
MSVLARLEKWYRSHCDGLWEQEYGVEIETLDNPGWRVRIDLQGTALQTVPFASYKSRYDDESDWMHCWRDDVVFHIACGPECLETALRVFLDWAEPEADLEGCDVDK